MSPSSGNPSYDELLAKLHDFTLNGLISDLEDPEKRSPALYRTAMELLKENKINALTVKKSNLSKLEATLNELASDDDGEYCTPEELSNVTPIKGRKNYNATK